MEAKPEQQQPHYFEKPQEEVKIPAQPVQAPVESAPIVVPASEPAPVAESGAAGRRRRNLPSNLGPLPPVKQSKKIEEAPKEELEDFSVKQEPKEEPKEEPKKEEPVEEKAPVESQEDRKKRLMEQR